MTFSTDAFLRKQLRARPDNTAIPGIENGVPQTSWLADLGLKTRARNGWFAVSLVQLLNQFLQCCLVADHHCRTAEFEHALPFQIAQQARNSLA
jgi:hypothetical protein